MILQLLCLTTSAAASPLPQGLTLDQFRQGARSLSGFENEMKFVISPSYRKVRRQGRSQYIDTQDSIRKASAPQLQEVSPSARPVYVLSEEDIEQKIREVNSALLKKKIETKIKEEIKEIIEEENEPVTDKVSHLKIEENISMIEEMINENKMIQIVSDIINLEERQNSEISGSLNKIPISSEEKKNIKNIDGFDISLKNVPATPLVLEIPIDREILIPLMEIPISSEIFVIDDRIDEDAKPVNDDLNDMPKVPLKKSPISSIDFGLIQEV